jgi:hypothetical protein
MSLDGVANSGDGEDGREGSANSGAAISKTRPVVKRSRGSMGDYGGGRCYGRSSFATNE